MEAPRPQAAPTRGGRVLRGLDHFSHEADREGHVGAAAAAYLYGVLITPS